LDHLVKTLSKTEFAAYIARQLNHFFPDETVAPSAIEPAVSDAVDRMGYCISRQRGKYFAEGRFDHQHTDQYAMFLYFVGNSLFRRKDDLALAAKLYALNKALHSIDAYYEVELPDVFLFSHPLGTILGRARYSNYFVVYQHCTVGSNLDGTYPTLGEGVAMYGGSAIIGDCTIGANTALSFGTVVMEENVSADSIVFGRSPALVVKPSRRNVIEDRFKP
jgi:serine O-acetyltransferase